MHYYKFYISTPYCGTDEVEWLVTDAEYDDVTLGDILTDYVVEQAESFAYLRTGWDKDFDSDEDREEWIEDCFEASSWEEVSKEEYDFRNQ